MPNKTVNLVQQKMDEAADAMAEDFAGMLYDGDYPLTASKLRLGGIILVCRNKSSEAGSQSSGVQLGASFHRCRWRIAGSRRNQLKWSAI